MRVPANEARRVACIGTGHIGSGWIGHFLRKGYDVTAWDPAPDAEARLNRLLDSAWPALEELGFAPGASRDRLTVTATLAEAVADTHFVQESAFEDVEVKTKLLAEIDAVTDPAVVIASSTSGIKMSEMDGRTEHPERFVVGHPFLPPYLLPLVEVVGSPRTSPEAVAWASDFYRIAGKAVITMEKEVTGFVANRLQEAIWREAVHMVANGEATIDQIDLAVTAGPGLRWAFMGPCLSYYLAWGGDETAVPGLIETVATNAVQDYTRASVPPMTDALAAAMTSGYETLVQGRTTAELFPWRDKRILAVVKALEAADQAG